MLLMLSNYWLKEAHEKQKAIIMVTHDPRMTQWSDRVYRMQDGLLVEDSINPHTSSKTSEEYTKKAIQT